MTDGVIRPKGEPPGCFGRYDDCPDDIPANCAWCIDCEEITRDAEPIEEEYDDE